MVDLFMSQTTKYSIAYTNMRVVKLPGKYAVKYNMNRDGYYELIRDSNIEHVFTRTATLARIRMYSDLAENLPNGPYSVRIELKGADPSHTVIGTVDLTIPWIAKDKAVLDEPESILFMTVFDQTTGSSIWDSIYSARIYDLESHLSQWRITLDFLHADDVYPIGIGAPVEG